MKEMASNIDTEPLQGALFRKFRDAVLNTPLEDGSASVPPVQIHRSVLKVEDEPDQGQTWPRQ